MSKPFSTTSIASPRDNTELRVRRRRYGKPVTGQPPRNPLANRSKRKLAARSPTPECALSSVGPGSISTDRIPTCAGEVPVLDKDGKLALSSRPRRIRCTEALAHPRGQSSPGFNHSGRSTLVLLRCAIEAHVVSLRPRSLTTLRTSSTLARRLCMSWPSVMRTVIERAATP